MEGLEHRCIPSFDCNPLRRCAPPKPADPQHYAGMPKVARILCFHRACSPSLTPRAVSGLEKERDTGYNQGAEARTQSSARFQRVLLGGILITSTTARNVAVARGSPCSQDPWNLETLQQI